jgi:hypothetical protein
MEIEMTEDQRQSPDSRLCEAARELLEALEGALGTYRESYLHLGTGRHDPEKIPDPAWVVKARAAIVKAKPPDE